MDFISQALVHPDTQSPLKLDWQTHRLWIEDKENYKAGFKRGVPFVLPVKDTIEPSVTIHKDHGTAFYYQDHYQRDAEVFDYFEEFNSQVDLSEKTRLNQMIISRIPTGVSSILDVGCGSGWLSQAMVSEDLTVISMDISSRNPVEALKRNPHPRHEALIADVYHLPLKENVVDCIVASEVMEHVPEPALFLEKLIYVLKPGGKLIVTTPYNEQIQYHLCVHCNHPTPAHAHLHSFNEDNIKNLIPAVATSWRWDAFSHKYMSKSRLYVLLKGIPFGGWNAIDKMANTVWHQPMRLMLEIQK